MSTILVLDIIIGVILTEALTELLVKSKLFFPVREFVFQRSTRRVFYFLSDLLDCGYCTSVWIGFIVASVFSILHTINFTGNGFLDWFIFGLLLHRLSNVFHFTIDRVEYIDRRK